MEPGRRTPAPKATQVASLETALSWQWHVELSLAERDPHEDNAWLEERHELEVVAVDAAQAISLAVNSMERVHDRGVVVTGVFREGPVVLMAGEPF